MANLPRIGVNGGLHTKSVIYDIDITSRGDIYAKGGILAMAWHII